MAQTYSVITYPLSAQKDGSGWAENFLPRATLCHLQAAVNSRSGFVVTLEGAEPIRFNVPRRAADAFHECGRGILRGRLDGAMDRLNRELENTPSR